MRELDVLLNQFVESRYEQLTASELDEFDELLEQSDVDLYAWFTGRSTPSSDSLARFVDAIRGEPG